MNLIKLDKSLCDNCYKCLRGCPTKAIKFVNNERSIIDNQCIQCGLCHSLCPQSALSVVDQFAVIEEAIHASTKTVVSLAPSYVASFPVDNLNSIVTALKKIGFDYVEETSVGAEIVYKKYFEVIKTCQTPNVITTCCPSVTYLVESHYPDLINSMLQVVSPMVAHGKDIKRRYGKDTFVVFIGPCLSKISEAADSRGAVDAVMTFAQLTDWLEESDILLSQQPPTPFDKYGTLTGKGFPLGCMLENETYKYLHVDGIDNCKSILEDMQNKRISGLSIELNICKGSCVNGPEIPRHVKESHYLKRMKMQKKLAVIPANEVAETIDASGLDLSRIFHRRDVNMQMPTEEELQAILRKMRKYSKKDQLNCGACGYETCIDKAIAVYNGASNYADCLPYLREIAEEEHSRLISNSPNGICVLDEDGVVVLTNPKFDQLFNQNNGISSVGLPVDFMVDSQEFNDYVKRKESNLANKIYVSGLDKHFLVDLIYDSLKKQTTVFFMDISLYEKNKRDLERLQKDTLEKTNEVIDKQMRVAQEIAGLLGETTAETRINLNELRRLILGD